MPSGIITRGIGGFYYVKTESGVYECKARGIFRKEDITPLPGDRVVISIIDEYAYKGSIDRILPRESELIRPAVANVNQLAVVIAVKSPVPDFVLLDKLLVTARLKNINPLILINKVDLDDGEEYKKILNTYSKTGIKLILLSSKLDMGFDILTEAMKDKITVFAGQSGVGKSTILNRILKLSVMKTGEVSNKIERGRHTTRHAELIELESGGLVVDTPGFSSFELEGITCDDLGMYYPEFEEYLEGCRFSHCSHISEPCCAVKEAVEEGYIGEDRYLRYIELYKVLKKQKDNKYRK